MHVGIVSFEFPGLTKNGGIGTAYGRLAEHLLKKGHKVTVLFVNIITQPLDADVKNQPFRKKYPKTFRLGLIDVHRRSENLSEHNPWPVMRSLVVANEIKRINFSPDVLHFHDCLGLAWVTLNWQKYSGFLPKTKIVLGMHGPNFWVRDAHGVFTSDFHEFTESRLEKESFLLAPYVVSPSQYMLDYLKGKGWTRSGPFTEVIPNMNDREQLRRIKPEVSRPRRIVFFGRLEPRKGITLFVDAIKRLIDSKKMSRLPLLITFLGRDTRLPNNSMATEWISSEFSPYRNKVNFEFITHFDSLDCQKYFQNKKNCLVVLPSLADNSPYVVVECLEMGLNFICTNRGGQTELMEKSHISGSTFLPNARSLADILLNKLRLSKFNPPAASSRVIEANVSWINFHDQIFDQPPARKSHSSKTKKLDIAVAVRSFGSLALLKKTLDSFDQANLDVKKIFVFFNSSNFSQNQNQFLDIISVFKAEYTHLNCQFHILIGGWNDEMMQICAKETNASSILGLVEGDIISPQAQTILAKCTTGISSNNVCLLFGMQIRQKVLVPGPFCLENHLFFDHASKFPVLFPRSIEFPKSDANDRTISSTFSLKTEHLLRNSILHNETRSIPEVLVTNDHRDFFYSTWACLKSDFENRLQIIQPHLNSEKISLISLAYERLNLSRPLHG